MRQELSGAAETNTSGIASGSGAAPKPRPGLGSRRRISAIMSAMSSSSTPQSAAQRRRNRAARAPAGWRSAPASPDRSGRARSVAAPGIRRDRARTRRSAPGPAAALSTASTRASGAPSRSAMLVERPREIASLVERVDQRGGDHAVAGIVHDHRRLAGQMVGEADRLRRHRRRGRARLRRRRARQRRSTRSPRGPGPRRWRRRVRRASAARSGSKALSISVPRLLGKRGGIGFQRLARPSRPVRSPPPALRARRLRSRARRRRSSARSSSGLRSSSASMKAASSALGICKSLIACRSCGVRTIDWP